MHISYLGCGVWGFCLASLLAQKGHSVSIWTANQKLAAHLKAGQAHPRLANHYLAENMSITTHLEKSVKDADLIVESVTAAGIRPVFTHMRGLQRKDCPIVLTSKGIEIESGLLLCEIAAQVLGVDSGHSLLSLSGPSLVHEVVDGQPTTVVCAADNIELSTRIGQLFTTANFRVYPNCDLKGTSFGGALKNIFAIACGISDGLNFGSNSKAGIMSRGLHEMRKLAIVKQCDPETLNGLAGMGDLCATCLSTHSRNYRLGRCIAQGQTVEEAQQQIGMIVEGYATCAAAHQLAQRHSIEMPIVKTIYRILYEGLCPLQAVRYLMERAIKPENL